MARLIWLFLGCTILLASCTPDDNLSASNLPQDEHIQVYFNHRATGDLKYQEPYRKIKRQGDNLESLILEEIASAKSTIDLAVQELNLPQVAQALVKSHRAGVRVRVILDNNYSRSWSQLEPQEIKQLSARERQKHQKYRLLVDINQDQHLSSQEISKRDALMILRRARVPLIDDTADGSKGSGLMHHKFMVIDGQRVLTGSANFTVSGVFGDLDNSATRGNINHLLRIKQSAVAQLFTQEFNLMWGDRSSHKFGLAKPWRGRQSVSWPNTQVTIQFAPTSTKRDWQDSSGGLIAHAIGQAQQEIKLALFVFSEQVIADVLLQKHQQGVKIAGVFDPGFAYRYYSEVLDMMGLTLYRQCQPEVDNNPWVNSLSTIGIAQMSAGDKFHHKFSIIDDDTVISGSQNWSNAGNHYNDELVIVIHNKLVAQHFVKEFASFYNQSSQTLPKAIKYQLNNQHKSCAKSN